MKLCSIEIEGFRGAQRFLRVDFGKGFTIITGKNGSGKSTICDAVEYVLTGSLQRFQTETEKGERIDDYLWWRGSDHPARRIVTLVFKDEQGNEYTVSRGPATSKNQESLAQLYDPSRAPEHPLVRLCQTSIIRDENITRFSTDMSETERFEFVSRAIGLSGFKALEERLAAVSKRIREITAVRTAEYERAREEVGRITSELSQARITAASSGGVELDKLVEFFSQTLGKNLTDVNEVIKATRALIGQLRSEIDEIEGTAVTLRESAPAQPRRAELSRAIELQRAQITAKELTLQDFEKRLQTYDDSLKQQREHAPTDESVAQLVEQGTRLGLQDGRCPLCGSVISENAFHAHITDLRRQLELRNSSLSGLTRDRADIKRECDTLRLELDELKTAYHRNVAELDSIQSAFIKAQGRVKQLGIESDAALSTATQSRRERIQSLEKNLSSLQSSMALGRVAELERQLSIVQEKLVASDLELTRATQAETSAKEVEGTLRRVSAEVVDARLSDLSPLLSELYLRLKPHTEWAEIQYFMRGDVRRFLSFSVGPDINPRFVFSSGQRRALGLSFLLAVHLSRSWCVLKALLLDDPVQHIDDYRAMHLVEVLSALRANDRQIVCAVEDPELADLLCRRLRVGASRDGVKVEMKFDTGTGISSQQSDVVPLVSHALLSA